MGVLFLEQRWVMGKSGNLAYVPDGSTTVNYALNNETHGLASLTSILPDLPPIMMPFDFDLKLTVLIILHACMT